MLRRRAMMTGLLGGALASLSSRRQARGETGINKRIVIWFTPNGCIEEAWRPTGGETDFQLGEILSPLEVLRDKLIVFGPSTPYGGDIREERGISIHVNAEGPSGGHDGTKLLTGMLPMTVEGNNVAGGISVDQHIASVVGASDAFRSVALGARAGNPVASDPISWYGAGQPVPVENNPTSAFSSLFAGVGEADADVLRRRARRREVLRSAREEVGRLKPHVGTTDRQRLDLHESALDELDARLTKVFDCTPPDEVGAVPTADWEENWDTYSRLLDTMRAQSDILATALGCGVTRVATYQVGYPAANTRYSTLSHDHWHHAYSHGWEFQGGGPGIVNQEGVVEATPEQCRQAMIDIHKRHAEELAYFASRLAEMPESDGSSVLDNTVIFWCNELSDSVYHTHQNMPFLLLGGAGGHFKTGRYVTYARKSHTDLLVSLCQAMGLPDETFGDPTFCGGPLPNLT